MIGLQLVKVAHLRAAQRDGELAVYAATTLGVVFLNLLQGVVVGVALALVLVLSRVVRAEVHAEPVPDDPRGLRWRVTVTGSLTFLGLPRLTRVLAEVPAGTHVTLTLGGEYLDGPASDTIQDWIARHEANGGAVAVVRTLKPGRDVLSRPRCAANRVQPRSRAAHPCRSAPVPADLRSRSPRYGRGHRSPHPSTGRRALGRPAPHRPGAR